MQAWSVSSSSSEDDDFPSPEHVVLIGVYSQWNVALSTRHPRKYWCEDPLHESLMDNAFKLLCDCVTIPHNTLDVARKRIAKRWADARNAVNHDATSRERLVAESWKRVVMVSINTPDLLFEWVM